MTVRVRAALLLVTGGAGCVDNKLTPMDTCPPAEVTVSWHTPSAACVLTPDAPTVTDPWTMRRLWAYDEADLLTTSAVTPVVGYLTDDNGDGTFGPGDEVTVVGVFWDLETQGRVMAFRGSDGEPRWRWDDAMNYSGVTLADADRDGAPEILAIDEALHVVSLDAEGRVRWRSTQIVERGTNVAVADLGSTGFPSVIADQLVLDGRDGSLQFEPIRYGYFGAASVADLDLDGRPEVIAGDGVFDATGVFLWDSYFRNPGFAIAAVIQADADDAAEVAWAEDRVGIWDTDGQRLSETATIENGVGAPCVGDFDGDGAPEVGWPTRNALTLVELDGSFRWQAPTYDGSGLAGCSGFDLDGDGALEVLYADETDFMILDGRTGARRYTDAQRSSGTSVEYPVPADVDGDGHAEILVVSQGDAPALQVFTHAGAGWAPGGPAWPSHDYSLTNLGANGAVPHLAAPSWLGAGTFRARPAVDPVPQADLRVEANWRCVEDGPATLSLTALNDGAATVPAGVILRVSQAGMVVDVVVETDLPGGATSAGWELTGFTATEVVSIVIDPDGEVEECDEADNELEVAGPTGE